MFSCCKKKELENIITITFHGMNTGQKCKFIDFVGSVPMRGAFSLIFWLVITQRGHDTYQIEAEYLSY